MMVYYYYECLYMHNCMLLIHEGISVSVEAVSEGAISLSRKTTVERESEDVVCVGVTVEERRGSENSEGENSSDSTSHESEVQVRHSSSKLIIPTCKKKVLDEEESQSSDQEHEEDAATNGQIISSNEDSEEDNRTHDEENCQENGIAVAINNKTISRINTDFDKEGSSNCGGNEYMELQVLLKTK